MNSSDSQARVGVRKEVHNVIQGSLGKLELKGLYAAFELLKLEKGTYRFDLLHECGLLERKHSGHVISSLYIWF